MSDSGSSSDGIGVLGLLGVAFVVLKLTGVITWSWWYVTMPFWGVLAIIFALLALFGVGYIVGYLVGKIWTAVSK